MVTILTSTALRGATLIRGEALVLVWTPKIAALIWSSALIRGNTVDILINIPKSKSNQVMKFGPLIEYNMRNTFLEKSCTKYDGEAIPRPF